MQRRGFTLIELLVVIAIIGVLSSVVLASLNSARSKGNDAGIRENIATITTQAALFYDNNSNSYGTDTDCTAGMFADPTISAAVAATDSDNGTGTVACFATDTAYAISSDRPAGSPSAFWCADSTGKKCGIAAQATGSSCGTCATQN
jgi:prepilin-type N-terminal cleavage/methylation domain-containing protein